MLGSRSPPPRASRLAALAGRATVGWYGPSGTRDSGSNAAILLWSNVPSSTGVGEMVFWTVMACCRSVRYWVPALSSGG